MLLGKLEEVSGAGEESRSQARKAFVSLDKEAELHLGTMWKAGAVGMGWREGGSFTLLDLRCRELTFTTK